MPSLASPTLIDLALGAWLNPAARALLEYRAHESLRERAEASVERSVARVHAAYLDD